MTRFERLFGSKKAILRVYPPPPPPAAGAMAGASFIRTDYFVDPMERPEHGGPMRIDPEGLLRYRRSLDADSILILADVQVKYARMLVNRSLAASARPAREAGADAVVVPGHATGEHPSAEG